MALSLFARVLVQTYAVYSWLVHPTGSTRKTRKTRGRGLTALPWSRAPSEPTSG